MGRFAASDQAQSARQAWGVGTVDVAAVKVHIDACMQ
jgi:hypothetical protein